MMKADFLIRPLSVTASEVLECMNTDIERQDAMEQGKPFARHACSLDVQIRIHHMAIATRLALIEELKCIFERYVRQPNKSLARIAMNYLNILAYGSLNTQEHSAGNPCPVSDTVYGIQRAYATQHREALPY